MILPTTKGAGWGELLKNMFSNKPSTILVDKTVGRPLSEMMQDAYEKMDMNDDFFRGLSDIGIDEEAIMNSGDQALLSLVDRLGGVKDGAIGAKEAFDELGTTVIKVPQTVTKANGAFSKFTSGLKSIASTALTTMAVMAAMWLAGEVIKGIHDWIKADEIAIKKGKEATKVIEDEHKAYKELSNALTEMGKSASGKNNFVNTEEAIDEIAKKYDELHDGVNELTNLNESLSTEDYQEYLNICNQIAEQFPSLVSGYDEQGNAILNIGNTATQAEASLLRMYEASKLAANVNMFDEIQDSYTGFATQIKLYEEENAQLQDELNELNSMQQKNDKEKVDISKDQWNQIQGSNLLIPQWSLDKEELVNKVLGNYNLYGDYNLSPQPEVGKDFLLNVPGLIDQSETVQQSILASLSDTAEATVNAVGAEITSDINDKTNQISANELYIKDQKSKISGIISKYLETSDVFDDQSDQLQNALLSNLSNLNMDLISSRYKGQIVPYIYGELIQPINNLEPEMQTAIDNILDIKPSKMSAGKYVQTVQSGLADAFGGDPTQIERWKQLLGFENIFTEIGNAFHDIKSEFEIDGATPLSTEDLDELYGLSLDDLRIYADLVKDGVYKTWEELQKAFDDMKKKQDIKPDGVLSDIFNDENYKSSVESNEKNLSSLTSALETLRSEGTLTAEAMRDLQEEFPSLTDFTTEGLSKAGTKYLDDWIGQFKDGWTDFSEDGQKQLDTYLANFTASYKDVMVSEYDATKAIKTSLQDGRYGVGIDNAVNLQFDAGISALKKKYGEDLNWNIVLALKDQFSGDIQSLIDKYGEYKLVWDIEIKKESIQREIDSLTSQRELNSSRQSLSEALGFTKTKADYEKDNEISRQLVDYYEQQKQIAIDEIRDSYRGKDGTLRLDDIGLAKLSATRAQYDKLIFDEEAMQAENDKLAKEETLRVIQNRGEILSAATQEANRVLTNQKDLNGVGTKNAYQDAINATTQELVNAREEYQEILNLQKDFENEHQGEDLSQNETWLGYFNQLSSKKGDIDNLKDSISELRNEMNNLPITEIQNARNDIARQVSEVENQISNGEVYGKSATGSQYQRLIDLSQEDNEKLKEEQVILERRKRNLENIYKDAVENNQRYKDTIEALDQNRQQQFENERKQAENEKALRQLPLTRLQNQRAQLTRNTTASNKVITDKRNAGLSVSKAEYEQAIRDTAEERFNLFDQRNNIQSQIDDMIAEQEAMIEASGGAYDALDVLANNTEFQRLQTDLENVNNEINSMDEAIIQLTTDMNNIKMDKLKAEFSNLERDMDKIQRNLDNPKKTNTAEDYIVAIEKNFEEQENLRNQIEEKQKEFYKVQHDQNGGSYRISDLSETSEKYQTWASELAELETQLYNTTSANDAFVNSLLNLPMDGVTKAIQKYQDELQNLQNIQDLNSTKGKSMTASDYANNIAVQKNINKEALTSRFLNNAADKFYGAFLDYDEDSEVRKQFQENAKSATETLFSGWSNLFNWEKASKEIPYTSAQEELDRISREADQIQSQFDKLETQGKEITEKSYSGLINVNDRQLKQARIVRDEALKLLQGTNQYDEVDGVKRLNQEWITYSQNYSSAVEAVEGYKAKQLELNDAVANLPLLKLQNELSDLETNATAIQDLMTLDNAKGLKATVKDYQKLTKNSKEQIKNLKQQNQELAKQSIGLDKNGSKYREIADNIRSNASAIRGLEADIIDYDSQARRLITTQSQDLASAISSALSEMGTDTGLSNDTIDSLMIGFSDLAGKDVSNMFYRTAEGIKVDIRELERLARAENEVKSTQLAKDIEDKRAAIAAYQNQIGQGKSNETLKQMNSELQDLLRQQAEYFATYAEQMEQLSRLSQIDLASSTENQGANFDKGMSYLKEAKEMYDKGLIGTDDFKARAAYLNQWGFTDKESFIEDWNKVSSYVTDDGMDVGKFLNDLVSEGLGHWDDATNNFIADFDSMEEAAREFKGGISTDWFADAWGKTEEYGAFVSYISSAEEAELKTEELQNSLTDAQIKMAEMKLSGASQEDIEKQQEVIDMYEGRLQDVAQATEYYYENEEQMTREHLANAKETIKAYNDYYKQALDRGDEKSAQKILDAAQDFADQTGFELEIDAEVGSIKINKESYEEAKDNYKTAIEEAIEEAQQNATEARENVVHEISEAQSHGVDLSRKKYGNIDTQNRQEIVWSATSLNQNKQALQDWYQEASDDWTQFMNETIGETSTIIGASDQFGDVEIAFSPMLQTDQGPQLLGRDTVNRYIGGLISELSSSGDGWTTEDLINLDSQGLEIDGQIIKGLIADVGETARQTAESMHYVESYEMAQAEFDDANNYLKLMQQISDESQNTESDVANAFQTLSSASSEAFDSIVFNDGDLTTGFEAEEQALDSLLDKFGMTQDQGQMLIGILSELGLIDYESPEVTVEADTSEVEEAGEKVDSIKKEMEKPVIVRGQYESTTQESSSNADTSAYWSGQSQNIEEIQSQQKFEENAESQQPTIDAIGLVQTAITSLSDIVSNGVDTLSNLPGEIGEAVASAISGKNNPESPNGPQVLPDGVQVQKYSDDGTNLSHAFQNQMNSGFFHLQAQVDPPPEEELEVTGTATFEANTDELDQATAEAEKPVEKPVTMQLVGGQPTIPESKDSVIKQTKETDEVKNETTNQVTNIEINNEGALQSIEEVSDALTDLHNQQTQPTIDADNSQAINKIISTTTQLSILDSKTATPSITIDAAEAATQIHGIKTDLDNLPTTKIIHVVVQNEGEATAKGQTGTMILPSNHAYASGNLTQKDLDLLPTIPITEKLHFGNGDVGLPTDEEALVNELGTESIIRDGHWFTIPGGMHVENLKKGDVILNHKQTADLIRSGKALGHGKAYAQGTALNGMPAHPDGVVIDTSGMSGKGGGGSGSDNSGSDYQKSVEGMTKANNDNTGSTNKNTEAKKKEIKVYDWVERRLKYFADKTEEIADRITDYVTKVFKRTNLDREMKSIEKEIDANIKAAPIYYERAEQKANSFEYYDSNSNKQTVTIPEKYRKLVREGRIDTAKNSIEDMDISDDAAKGLAEAIDEYQSWIDKAKDAEKNARSLENTWMELYEEFVNIPLDYADKAIEKIESSMNNRSSVEDVLSSYGNTGARMMRKYGYTNEASERTVKNMKNSKVYKIQDKLMKENLKDQEDVVKQNRNATKAAQKEANKQAKNLNKVSNVGQTISSLLNSEAQKLTGKKADNMRKRAKKVSKAVENNELIDTTYLTGEALEKAKEYNKVLQQNTIAQKALVDATERSVESEAELAKMRVENAKQGFENVKKYYEDRNSYRTSVYERDNARAELNNVNDYMSKDEYKTKRTSENKTRRNMLDERNALISRRNNLVNKGDIKYGDDTWRQMTEEINNLDTSIIQSRQNSAELFKEWANSPLDKAAQAIEKLKTKFDALGGAMNAAKSGLSSVNSFLKNVTSSLANNAKAVLKSTKGQKSYIAQNKLLDDQLENQYNQVKEDKDALETANKNLSTAKSNQKSADKKVAKRKKKVEKYADIFSSDQLEQLNKGETIDLGKITDKKVVKAIEDYNGALDNSAQKAQEVQDAQEAVDTASKNLLNDQMDYSTSYVQNEIDKFNNIKDYYSNIREQQSTRFSNLEKDYARREAHGQYKTMGEFDDKINHRKQDIATMREEQHELAKQLADSVSSGKIKEGSDEWKSMMHEIELVTGEIKDTEVEVENLTQDQIDLKYDELFERAAKKADLFIDRLQTIVGLISDDMMFDNDGLLTEYGALALQENAKALNANISNLKRYIAERREIQDDYNRDAEYGQEKYDRLMAENQSNIEKYLKDANSTRQAVLDIIKKQSEEEVKAINKVIDKRKEALQKKKDYYDWDKTLRGKTKDIQQLEAQVAALSGIETAEAKSKRAKLQEELSNANEDLEDTIRNHVYETQVEGLDKMSEQLNENLEKWIKELAQNLDKASDTITNAINNTSSPEALSSALGAILGQFGISESTLEGVGFSLNTKNYASGTKRITKETLANTNEKGREIIVTKTGILTKLEPGDGVVPNNLTENFFEAAKNYPMMMNTIRQLTSGQNMLSQLKDITSNNVGGVEVHQHYDNLINIQGNADATTVEELKKFSKEFLERSYEYTSKRINQDYRRTGGLRKI